MRGDAEEADAATAADAGVDGEVIGPDEGFNGEWSVGTMGEVGLLLLM